MSGSSLDGLDIAWCEFNQKSETWSYELKWAETLAFDRSLRQRLEQAPNANAFFLAETDALFARFSGEAVQAVCKKAGKKPDLVASHGHTIFHQPAEGFTTQIGNGGLIAASCGLPVASDFRTIDVGLGGQGAPLVPVGEMLLFPGFDGYLNLGGIANLTIKKETLLAFDVSACNQWFNYLAQENGLEYDEGGKLALAGNPDTTLVETLCAFFNNHGGSISNEFVRSTFTALETSSLTLEDKMASAVSASGKLIHAAIAKFGLHKVLVTGGGAFNPALMQAIRLHHKVNFELIVPDDQTVQFKEAIIFAFLGVLRKMGKVNVENSVTGSSQSHIAGALYQPF